MKKNILFTALAAAVIIACAFLMSDGLTYLVASLMALTIMGLIHYNRSRVMKLTRWAKANPKKAQVFITGLQLVLMVLGIMAGYNLKELGYELSASTGYVFGAIIVIGFLSVPFMPKRSTIAIPRKVNRHRLGYLGIALSSLLLMILTGNRIEDVYPNSTTALIIKTIDQSIFPDDIISYSATDQINNNYGRINSEAPALPVFAAIKTLDKNPKDHLVFSDKITSHKNLKKAAKAKKKGKRKAKKDFRKKLRKFLVGGSCAMAVFLIFLLIITTCAGLCLAIYGGAILAESVGWGILLLLLGGLIGYGSVRGIMKVSQWCKRN